MSSTQEISHIQKRIYLCEPSILPKRVFDKKLKFLISRNIPTSLNGTEVVFFTKAGTPGALHATTYLMKRMDRYETNSNHRT